MKFTTRPTQLWVGLDCRVVLFLIIFKNLYLSIIHVTLITKIS